MPHQQSTRSVIFESMLPYAIDAYGNMVINSRPSNRYMEIEGLLLNAAIVYHNTDVEPELAVTMIGGDTYNDILLYSVLFGSICENDMDIGNILSDVYTYALTRITKTLGIEYPATMINDHCSPEHEISFYDGRALIFFRGVTILHDRVYLKLDIF